MGVFHPGEIEVQSRAGVRELAEQIGRIVRPEMPDAHRAFFQRLPYVVVGTLDDDGSPVASMLVGAPGFVESPDARSLVIRASASIGDPIAHGLLASAPVGLLGIELETRRRNRANGRIVSTGENGVVVAVDESFGNCPQYIQARAPLAVVRREPGAARVEGPLLSDEARAIVRAADTLFIASASREDRVDVSHRGGKPGFVKTDESSGHTILTMPDFSGNNLFMTLGNLESRPRAGIAVVDFASGALLSIVGNTETIWDGPEMAAFEGAERLLRIRVERAVVLPGAIPFAWSEPEFAKQLARTGTW